jgi:hypothetical protein
MRPTSLVRSAAAAALVCLVGADAFASEPVAADPAPQPSSLMDRLAGDEPLFLVQNGTATWGGFYVHNGVLKDPDGMLFGVQSQEGDELFRFGMLGQFRGVIGYFDGDDGEDEEFETGFEFGRLQSFASGHIGSPDIYYRFMLEYANGSATLEDAYIAWRAGDDWGIRGGQFRNPIGGEWLVWEGGQIATERSLAHLLLNGDDRVQGVSMFFDPSDKMRAEVALHDGFGSQNTGFFASDFHVGLSGRFEFLMDGAWEDYGTFFADVEESLMALGVGAGMSWGDGDDREGHLTGDLTWKRDRMAMFFAAHINPAWFDGEETTNFGGTAQFAFRANDNFEPFIRGSVVFVDDEFLAPDAEDTFFEITGGVNWFPLSNLRNRFRITSDVSILPNGSPIDIDRADYLASEELEVVGRIQGEFKL